MRKGFRIRIWFRKDPDGIIAISQRLSEEGTIPHGMEYTTMHPGVGASKFKPAVMLGHLSGSNFCSYSYPRYRFARPGANRYNASGIGAILYKGLVCFGGNIASLIIDFQLICRRRTEGSELNQPRISILGQRNRRDCVL